MSQDLATTAKQVGDRFKVDWNVVSPDTYRRAFSEEWKEHRETVRGDPMKIGEIVAAHLKEDPYYYAHHGPISEAAEKYWATHQKPKVFLGGTRLEYGCIIIAVIFLMFYTAAAVKASRRVDASVNPVEGLKAQNDKDLMLTCMRLTTALSRPVVAATLISY